jgi:hypothetical protein
MSRSKVQGGRWPRANRPPFFWSDPAPAGIPVLSRSGTIRGITLGGSGPCPSRSCDGYLICVDWETGQVTFPCSVGWENRGDHIRIVAGGEITARVVNPVDPIPREEWPVRNLVIDVTWPTVEQPA